jgi:hypothetical protein
MENIACAWAEKSFTVNAKNELVNLAVRCSDWHRLSDSHYSFTGVAGVIQLGGDGEKMFSVSNDRIKPTFVVQSALVCRARSVKLRNHQVSNSPQGGGGNHSRMLFAGSGIQSFVVVGRESSIHHCLCIRG